MNSGLEAFFCGVNMDVTKDAPRAGDIPLFCACLAFSLGCWLWYERSVAARSAAFRVKGEGRTMWLPICALSGYALLFVGYAVKENACLPLEIF